MLLRQSEARRDPPIGAEQLADEFRAITFLAAMQQYNVIGEPVGAVQELADRGQGLKIRGVAIAAGNAAPEYPKDDHSRPASAGRSYFPAQCS